MKYICAALLCALKGNCSPSVEDLHSIIGASGCEFDAARAQQVVDALRGQSVEQLMANGRQLMANVSVGPGGSNRATAEDKVTDSAPVETEAQAADSEEEGEMWGIFD
eukprot:NODE_10237_length_492_cov_42.523288_g10214_i0.p1 GENE.NODE_10237_length_492_cov_42.523288_g10214_i0~~NODE_10237_length_492_cov_42.523288_g10214_i0.p1  ORF type:complete len:108 (-),score=21.71 NODE_10237_length_492_cov_42.523288_g10214_i0:102-425(-)